MLKKYGMNLLTIVTSLIILGMTINWIIIIPNKITILTLGIGILLVLADLLNLFKTVEVNRLKERLSKYE